MSVWWGKCIYITKMIFYDIEILQSKIGNFLNIYILNFIPGRYREDWTTPNNGVFSWGCYDMMIFKMSFCRRKNMFNNWIKMRAFLASQMAVRVPVDKWRSEDAPGNCQETFEWRSRANPTEILPADWDGTGVIKINKLATMLDVLLQFPVRINCATHI